MFFKLFLLAAVLAFAAASPAPQPAPAPAPVPEAKPGQILYSSPSYIAGAPIAYTAPYYSSLSYAPSYLGGYYRSGFYY